MLWIQYIFFHLQWRLYIIFFPTSTYTSEFLMFASVHFIMHVTGNFLLYFYLSRSQRRMRNILFCFLFNIRYSIGGYETSLFCVPLSMIMKTVGTVVFCVFLLFNKVILYDSIIGQINLSILPFLRYIREYKLPEPYNIFLHIL
jgi:hypothetical protein